MTHGYWPFRRQHSPVPTTRAMRHRSNASVGQLCASGPALISAPWRDQGLTRLMGPEQASARQYRCRAHDTFEPVLEMQEIGSTGRRRKTPNRNTRGRKQDACNGDQNGAWRRYFRRIRIGHADDVIATHRGMPYDFGGVARLSQAKLDIALRQPAGCMYRAR